MAKEIFTRREALRIGMGAAALGASGATISAAQTLQDGQIVSVPK